MIHYTYTTLVDDVARELDEKCKREHEITKLPGSLVMKCDNTIVVYDVVENRVSISVDDEVVFEDYLHEYVQHVNHSTAILALLEMKAGVVV